MNEAMLLLAVVGTIVLAVLVLQLVSMGRASRAAAAVHARLEATVQLAERQERDLRDELGRARLETAEAARAGRAELGEALERFGHSVRDQLTQMVTVQNNQIDGFAQSLATLTQANEAKLESVRVTVDDKLRSALDDARQGREEGANTLRRFGEALNQQLAAVTQSSETRLKELRETIDGRLEKIQQDNAQKLEQMRQTVDEKLHATLEQRLGESFKLVSERLEQVHKGLGEMQSLAVGVGDLKRVLTNVKTRGTWGEVQLGSLLEQVLTPEQYERNVATVPGSRERVEFAIRFPGREDGGAPVWLPIDAKFPLEDYQRLQDAQERVHHAEIDAAAKALENRLREEAKTLREKYIAPPHTTDFGLLYLPTEGLYAEVLRRPGLVEALQRDQRVTIAGPTTLLAMLNSLQMGFRTLAIEQRSSEVWALLGAVKAEFGKFGGVLAKTRQQLQTVANSIVEAETRTRQMERKLKDVEALPDRQAARLIGQAADGAEPGASG
ncbi:MAG: DNA recombination protein RmuC [Burkholderiales bacterium]|nr:DNA recombination protein RmuC [Burkholderiales bacterium]